ncbi:hypothetical protein GGI23_005182 [Coemansia sp. RSA 2559]|nr:hypothetical protein GGI23_005182 [Coemansia sp. RSA 2559]KAJ2863258.1 hypothetical protein GGI22_002000 [Coemansia erecta]
MSESSTVLSTEALTAAMEAAAAVPGQTEAATEPQLLSPFPALDSDHEKEENEEDPMAAAQFRPDDIGTATAAALSSAITRAQIPVVDGAHAFSFAAQPQGVASNGGGGLATTTMMGAPPVMTSASTQDESVLATLQRSAHDQVMEIMSSYHSTNAHRRRSSVEAVAAASSVLASFANSAKSYMDSEAAAAALAAAAVNSSPPQITQMSSYSTQAAQHNAAAAALLAASGMHTVMLPTIPSVSTSLQGTPAPGERLSLSGGMDDESLMSAAATSAAMAAISSPIAATSGAPSAMAVAAGDSSMQHVLDMAAFSSLSPTSLAAANQITSDMASASIAASATLQASHSGQGALSVETTPQNKKRKTRGGRQRKAVAGVSAATAAAIAVADPAPFNEQPAKRRMYSDDDDDEDDDDDGILDRAENGMPLTPDAPGSGRPGSLRHLTADERRARRLQRNRLAAKECRQKKKAYITNLEDQVHDLSEENSRLRKEIEELNAKLTLGGMRGNSSATTPVLDARQLLHQQPSADYGADSSIDSMSSPSLASKRPHVSVRSTSSANLVNGGY